MIIIGIVLFILGFGVFIIAWRGRIVARGAFCNACRFDLAGLDLKSPSAQCPECGCSIHQESARRPLLRGRSRLGLVVAIILMLAGSGAIWAGAAGKSGAIITAMPDGMVIWLTDRGVDKALDELVVRASQVPNSMSVQVWDHAIEAGLAHQADTTIIWDVRWGEVLFQALIQSRMSDERLKQYFVNADEIELTVRDRVHSGASGFGYMLKGESTRNKMMTGGTVDYQLNRSVKTYGVKDEDPIWTRDPNTQIAHIPLWLDSRTSSSGGRSATWKMHDYFAQEPGNVVDVYFDYEMTLVPIGETEPIFTHTVREEFTIRIIDKDEPIVPTYVDEPAARKVIENLGMSPIRIRTSIQDPKPNSYTQVFSMTFRCQVDLAPLALGVFLSIDGQEVELGKVENSTAKGSFAGTVSLGIPPGDESALESASKIHAMLLKDQSATIILRPNPELAEDLPEFDRILDVELIFEDVPIVIVETYTELNTPDWDGAQLKATLLDD